MNFTAYLHKKLVDLLNDKRIVVWYDSEKKFNDFIYAFKAPNCVKIMASESILRGRRKADETYRKMNESENTDESNANMAEIRSIRNLVANLTPKVYSLYGKFELEKQGAEEA